MPIARLLFIATMLLTLYPVHADDQARFQQPSGEGRLWVPPPEAFMACDGKKEGDTASFTDRRGEIRSGVCKTIPARLAAIPDRPPRGGQDAKKDRPPQ